jgi:hypothetical protein
MAAREYGGYEQVLGSSGRAKTEVDIMMHGTATDGLP